MSTWSSVYDLTPWEERSGRWYKRDDAFAPAGSGGINGSKLRACYWLAARAASRGATALVSGASLLSPQLPMVAAVARHLGLDCTLVIGGTTVERARRRPGVALATVSGAHFRTIAVGYNPALQREVERLSAETGATVLRYGISPDPADPLEVRGFHAVGAAQVRNLPPGVRHLVLPCGSANTAIGVLIGLAREHADLARVTLVGIGPTRLGLIHARLDALGASSAFRPDYPDHRVLEERRPRGPIVLAHHDLHARRAVTYGQRVPWTSDGLVLHPTYEGKVARYLATAPGFDGWRTGDGTTALWIVGAEPRVPAW